MQETTYQSGMKYSGEFMKDLKAQRDICATYFSDLNQVRQAVILIMIGALSMAIVTKIVNGFCSKNQERQKDRSEAKDIEKCMKANQEAYYDNIIDQTMSESFIDANLGPEKQRNINFGLVNGFLEKTGKDQ